MRSMSYGSRRRAGSSHEPEIGTISRPMSTTSAHRVPRLNKRRMAELTRKAKSLGLTPEHYVRRLIEQDLELDRRARTTTFTRLMAPPRDVDEAELDRLVDAARTRHHKSNPRKR